MSLIKPTMAQLKQLSPWVCLVILWVTRPLMLLRLVTLTARMQALALRLSVIRCLMAPMVAWPATMSWLIQAIAQQFKRLSSVSQALVLLIKLTMARHRQMSQWGRSVVLWATKPLLLVQQESLTAKMQALALRLPVIRFQMAPTAAWLTTTSWLILRTVR